MLPFNPGIKGRILKNVLFLVAIDTKVLPVRSIRGIVQVISVLVVNRQEMSVGMIELPAAPTADQAVDLKGPLPVIAVRRSVLFQFLEHFVDRFITAHFFNFGISSKTAGHPLLPCISLGIIITDSSAYLLTNFFQHCLGRFPEIKGVHAEGDQSEPFLDIGLRILSIGREDT
jgi:hypothetical protein